MFRIFRVVAVIIPFFLSGCPSDLAAPSSAPADFSVTAGESRVVLNWTPVAGETYWVYYKAGSTVTTSDHDYIGRGITSPAVITGLTNGTPYSFIINASNNGSKTGPTTPVLTATPRLVGPSTWRSGTELSGNSLNSVAYGKRYFVAVGDAATVFAAPYSYAAEGGVTAWNPATLPVGISASTNLKSVIYDGSQFVALGDDGKVVATSDMTTWTEGAAIGAPTMNALAFAYVGGPVYVAVGAGGKIFRKTSSAIAEAWSAVADSKTTNDLYGVAYVNGRFIAVGAGGVVITSPDGDTWTQQTSNTTSNLRSVAVRVTSSGATYVAVGDSGAILSSADAVTWSPETTLPTAQNLYSICFGPDGQFIAVGAVGTIVFSTTGLDGSWSAGSPTSRDLYSIAPADVFMATGASGANVSGK